MSATQILDRLVSKRQEGRPVWSLAVDRSLCLGPPKAKHMSGGACTAAMIYAIENETGKPVIQAATQFLNAPKANEETSIAVEIAKMGRSICQARATLSVDKKRAAILTATVGSRNDTGSFTWTDCGNAEAVDNCDRIPFVREDVGDLHTYLDMRLVETPDSGDMRFWVKPPDDFLGKASVFLSLIADYLPEAIHFSIGRRAGATSLDNSIRIVRRQRTEWLLCHTKLHGICDGIFHGSMKLFSDNGSLLGTASQSGVVHLLD